MAFTRNAPPHSHTHTHTHGLIVGMRHITELLPSPFLVYILSFCIGFVVLAVRCRCLTIFFHLVVVGVRVGRGARVRCTAGKWKLNEHYH